jgi:hypothetical protein
VALNGHQLSEQTPVNDRGKPSDGCRDSLAKKEDAMRVRSLFMIGLLGVSLAATAGSSLAKPTLRQDPPPLAGWGQPGSVLPSSDEDRYLRDNQYRPRFGGANRDFEPYSPQQFSLVGWGQPGSVPPPEEPIMGRNQNVAFKSD